MIDVNKVSEERVMRTVGPRYARERLDRFLAETFDGLSRSAARRAIEEGHIWVNGDNVRIQSRTLWEKDRVTWTSLPPYLQDAAQQDELAFQPETNWQIFGGQPSFLFRDKYVAILNKQPGIPVESTPKEDLRTCQRQIEATLRDEGLMAKRIFVAAAHRLDAGASGVLAFALRKRAAASLSEQFAQRTATRIYRALVVGTIPEDRLRIEEPIGRIGPGLKQGIVHGKRGKKAITHVQVVERFDSCTLIEVKLETGRTHQIRVHMAHLGFPLVGDWLYCSKEHAALCPSAPRMMLHALRLTLAHPVDSSIATWEAPLEPAFAEYLTQLTPA